MRYFFKVNDAGVVLSSCGSNRVPGDGGEDGETLPAGFVEVTEEQFFAYQAEPRSTFVAGELVAPAPLKPVLSKVAFFMLFTAPQRAAIRAYRVANPSDDQVEDFYDLLQYADVIDLNLPATQALMTAGLGLLVSKGLLTAQEATRIGAGTPPA